MVVQVRADRKTRWNLLTAVIDGDLARFRKPKTRKDDLPLLDARCVARSNPAHEGYDVSLICATPPSAN